MKVYSRDLREKVLQAYRNEEGSMMALSERFMVSLALFLLLSRDLGKTVILIPNLTEEGEEQQ